MFLTEIVLLAGILTIDAWLIAFSYGLTSPKLKLTEGIKLSMVMGKFQALMPILGYFFFKSASVLLSRYTQTLEHWIVFLVFLGLGGKIIYESFQDESKPITLSWMTLILLSLAASIDVFAGGILIFTQYFPIFFNTFLIGIIICILVGCGPILSSYLHHLPKFWLEISGGSLLMILGIKVLLDHTL